MSLNINTDYKNKDYDIKYNKIYNSIIFSDNNGLHLPFCYNRKCNNNWVKKWIRAGKPLVWNSLNCDDIMCPVSDKLLFGKYKYNIGYILCGDLIYVETISADPILLYCDDQSKYIIRKPIKKFTWSKKDINISSKNNIKP
jgi:hypothetical protein